MTNQQKAEQKKDTDVTQLLTEEQINEVLNSRILMEAGHKFFIGKTTKLLQAQSALTLRLVKEAVINLINSSPVMCPRNANSISHLAELAVKQDMIRIISKAMNEESVEKIDQFVQSAGWVRLDKDQRRPDNPYTLPYKIAGLKTGGIEYDMYDILLDNVFTPTDNGDGTESVWMKIRRAK